MANFDWSVPYNTTRKLPFRWLPLLIILEFAAALILFSLINLGSVGYDLVTVYSSNPNATVSEADKSSIPAFLRSKSRPSCESVNLDIGKTFSTNNSALTYTLNAVDDGETVSAASLVYHNNLLNNCTIGNVLINIESTSRNMAQQAIIRYGIDLSAHVACNIASRGGSDIALNLNANYNYIPSTVNIYDGFAAFPGRNATTLASLYWAEISLINYWYDLAAQFHTTSDSMINQSLPKAALYFNASRSSTKDISSFRFFETLYRIAAADENGVDRGGSYANNTSKDVADTMKSWSFYASADALAKTFYSTIITDLGQVASKPNIFADARLLEFFSSNFTRINSTVHEFDSRVPATPVGSYKSLKSTSGPLGVSPSVISARYLCQIPRRKSMGNFLISILVADLVLLQALWMITIWIATYFAERKDKRANWCEGCLENSAFGIKPELEGDTYIFGRQQEFSKSLSSVTSIRLHDSADDLLPGHKVKLKGPDFGAWRY